MAELHLLVPDSYIAEVRSFLRTISGHEADVSVSDIGREALGVYRWYLERDRRGGNAVASPERERSSAGSAALVEAAADRPASRSITPRTARPAAGPR